jgi:hypothetical protein
VGSPLDVGTVALTVNSAERRELVGDASTPAPGQAFLAVEVRLENKSGYRYPYRRYDFGLVDASNATYAPAVIPGEQRPLSRGQLEPQGDVTGTLLFRIPSSASGLTLTYRPPAVEQVAQVRLE